ncbi:hypothetical protein BJV82DRAFT_575716 [Fennellomyces sp. T-0311]|nr:hypothetical protein BJV82DRAFT_575716 [Fennellomyces sp. T-0311]
MYRWDVLSWVSTVGSEADLVSHVWSRLDECFYSLRMQTRRDHTSTAAAADANRDKTLTGMAPINAQQPSFRHDLLLFKNGVEFGTAECGKDDGSNGISQKELVETQLHCPKLLKSMLLQVSAKCNNRTSAVRKLKAIGFAQFHSPSGSVCRLSRTPSYRIATAPSLIQSGLLPI